MANKHKSNNPHRGPVFTGYRPKSFDFDNQTRKYENREKQTLKQYTGRSTGSLPEFEDAADEYAEYDY